MHLLYIHQYFNFPEGSGGTRSYDIATSLQKKGIQVTVITSSADLGNLCDSKKKWTIIERDNLTIYAVNCPYDNDMGFYRRIKSFLSFVWNSSRKALAIKADVVLATSTPLTIAIPALVKKFFNKTPFVFEVRDVWPEVPIKMGIIKNPIVIRLLNWFEKYTYKKASAIVPLSVGMYRSITSRINGLENKLTVIPNIAELNRFKNWNTNVKLPFNPEGKKIILYCGTLGKVNGISYMVDLASKTKSNTDIIYCVVGKGKELNDVLSLAESRDVLNKNFYYIGTVSKNELPYLYNIAAVGSSFVIDIPVLWDNSANKFFDTLAASRPILINHEGWQADTIRENKCGYVLPAILTEEAVNGFVDYITDDRLIKQSGTNAYRLAEEKYSLTIATEKYETILKAILNDKQ